MGLDATARRRWLGALLLLAALVMLIAGETFLKSRLQNLVFLFYWLLCLVFTGAAIMIAFLDARAVQRKGKKEARELIDKTLSKIESEIQRNPRRQENGEEA
jgi:hypothetical protein